MEYNYVDNYKELVEDVDECCICLDNLDKSQEIVILDCKHKFHLKCYLLWKNSGKPYSNHCPLCLRKDVEISNILNTVFEPLLNSVTGPVTLLFCTSSVDLPAPL